MQIILFLNFKFQNFWWEKYYLPLIDIGTLLAHALQMYLSCSWDNVLFSCRPFSHRKFTCQMFITWALANYPTWRHAFNLKTWCLYQGRTDAVSAMKQKVSIFNYTSLSAPRIIKSGFPLVRSADHLHSESCHATVCESFYRAKMCFLSPILLIF